MGIWDTGLLEDAAIHEFYLGCLAKFDSGAEHAEIRSEIEARCEEIWSDPHDACVAWFALAHAQWECGALQPDVLARVEDLIKSKKAGTHWDETDEDDRHKRQSALARFLGKIQQPKVKPRRRKAR